MMLSSEAFSAIAQWSEVRMAQILALFEEYNMLWDHIFCDNTRPIHSSKSTLRRRKGYTYVRLLIVL